ncbi:MAG: phosphate signaling complex protein PhoU [Candidatus Cloacimonetes bacterium]|nr:phosphate signaling complex protein PhoU [Candidatus Cloacimonadota bacterium]
MARESFQLHIKELEQELIIMGEMVVMAVNCSIEALKSRNISEAEKIISGDLLINKKRWDIEEKCINLIATQQPVASDLRDIIAILNIITDLERMGDHAEGIARIVIMYGNEPFIKPLIDIPRMAEITIEMLKKSLNAFIQRDENSAIAICKMDDNVDMLYEQIYRKLLTYMIEDPKTITRATYLLWVAHNLERIADRVTNICERIVFLVTGKMERINVSKY